MIDLKHEIAENDMLRSSFDGGCIKISENIMACKNMDVILESVRKYDSFAEHKDEHDGHAFGLVEFDEGWVFWEISQCAKAKSHQCCCASQKTLEVYFDYEFFQEDDSDV